MQLDPDEAISNGCAFHTTDEGNVDSILDTGIESDKLNSDTESIERILTELGYTDPFPFDRSEVVYCHVEREYVKWLLETGYENKQQALFRVDIDKVSGQLFVADMSIMSDLIDYDVAGPEYMMHAETPEEAVDLYRDSITVVSSKAELRSGFPSMDSPELIIDGIVPPEAVKKVN